jgi:septal ring factor EnvC (AmiA/AmiB activator)
MLDKIEFQSKFNDSLTATAGKVHYGKMSAVIFDLVEDKVNKVKEQISNQSTSQIVLSPKADCQCKAINEKISEIEDSIKGMVEGLNSFSMKIDDLENKIETLLKNKKVKLKEAD